MTLRILIADASEARCYDVDSRHALVHPQTELKLAATLTDAAAHLHDRDFKSDRPGRAFVGPLRPNRRGATAHHGIGAEASPRARESVLFARRISAALALAQKRTEFDQLVLSAGPHFLGLLRQALPPHLRAAVVQEIHKDLVHLPTNALRKHLVATITGGVEASASS